jgi:hypothetical protein
MRYAKHQGLPDLGAPALILVEEFL